MDVRIFIVIAIVLAAASPALACPPGARCVTAEPRRAELAPMKRVTAAPTARTLTLTVDRTHRAPDRARWTQRDLPARAGAQAPLVWQVIRTKVAAKLPTYRSARGVSVTLSPVIVVSDSFDSAPCIGVSGGF